MSATNPIITAPEEQFVVGESDFAFFGNYASRCEGGAILYCRKGSADATVNQYCGQVRRNTLILVLPGSLLMLTNRTEDFRMTSCAFSRDLFAEAGFRLEPSFFRILRENPITYPPARIVEGASTWFQMAAYTYRDRGNVFRDTIIRNRLQNRAAGELRQDCSVTPARQHRRRPRRPRARRSCSTVSSRSCTKHMRPAARQCRYYADKLCISTRYLSTIVRSVAHSSAKEFIDRSVLLEIKMLLQSTDLSVQEIAYRLRFPDQSYLGRYFKKHAGESPTEYRNTKK